MGEEEHKISIPATQDIYDQFWEIKEELHAANGEEVSHEIAFEELVRRWSGKRRERPDWLPGMTQRINIPRRGPTSGKAYVNINLDHNEDPFEVFITVGNSGTQINSWAEALAKTISNSLRAGVDPEVIADDLMGIRGPYTPAIDNGDEVYSVPDAVGIVLKRQVDGLIGEEDMTVRGTMRDSIDDED